MGSHEEVDHVTDHRIDNAAPRASLIRFGAPPHLTRKTTAITSDGCEEYLYPTTSDDTWIVVRGNASVCGVTTDKVEDHFLSALVIRLTGSFCLGENWRFIPVFGQPEQDKPFAKVAFSLETAAQVLFREEKTVTYLENQLKNVEALNHEETIQTAITALKYLMPTGLEANQMKVYVVGKDMWIHKALSADEIEEHLAVINS